MDSEARRAVIHGVTKRQTRLSDGTELQFELSQVFWYLVLCAFQ